MICVDLLHTLATFSSNLAATQLFVSGMPMLRCVRMQLALEITFLLGSTFN
jgi:hypothetical protein